MKLPPPVTLSNGLVAEVEADRFVPGAIQLLVDGTPQSHLNLRNPGEVFYEYVRRIAHIIDLFRPPGDTISALHLGAGAFTLPRYIEATRPGSRQQVIELEPELVALVRAAAPLPKRTGIRVRYGDAREMLGRLPAGMLQAVDLVVVDVFVGSRTPAQVSSIEFYERLVPLLTADGMIVVNTTGGLGQSFPRGQAATLAAVWAQVAAIGEPQTLKGRRFGNVVLIASAARSHACAPNATADVTQGDRLDWLPRLLARGPHPARMLVGRELGQWLRGAKPVTDATAKQSPPPPAELFG